VLGGACAAEAGGGQQHLRWVLCMGARGWVGPTPLISWQHLIVFSTREAAGPQFNQSRLPYAVHWQSKIHQIKPVLV
jgi:hypothetical protein